MATTNTDFRTARPVAADYSSCQYHLMDLNSSEQWVLCSKAGQVVMGVLEDKPDTAGDYGTAAYGGILKVVLGGTISDGDPLVSDTSGHAVKCTSPDQFVFGRAMEGGVANDVRKVKWSPEGYNHRPIAGMSQVSPVVHEPFTYSANSALNVLQSDGTAFDGTAGVLNHMQFGTGNVFGVLPIVGQTIAPAMAATGLDIQCDQTDNDGLEIYHGMLGASGRPFVVGTDPAFYLQVSGTIADVSGSDDFHIGFHTAEIPNGTIDGYTDRADLGFVTNAEGAWAIETESAGGGTTTTATGDTTANTVAWTARINVSSAGVVTYLIDGAAPTTTAAFTFATGVKLVPFCHIIQHGDLTGAVVLTDWICDYQ